MFDNPEIDKLIIFALLGMVAVLGIAVIFLAVKKNTYYVDESGNEIPPVSKKQAQARVLQQPVYEEPVIVKQPVEEIDPIESKLQASAVKPANPRGMVVSVIINGQAQQVTLNAFPVLIGRDSSSCGLPISEPAVSRRHARFTLENGNLYIEDVSEHNGTFINGSKLPPLGRSKINAGDKVNLGRAEIIIDKILY